MLLDDEPVPETKGIAYHEDNPDDADGTWKSVAITLPDVSEIQVGHLAEFKDFSKGSTERLKLFDDLGVLIRMKFATIRQEDQPWKLACGVPSNRA